MAENRTFTKTINGQQALMTARTPADAVRLKFNGWREQTAADTAGTAKAAETADTAGPAAKKATTRTGTPAADTADKTGK